MRKYKFELVLIVFIIFNIFGIVLDGNIGTLFQVITTGWAVRFMITMKNLYADS